MVEVVVFAAALFVHWSVPTARWHLLIYFHCYAHILRPTCNLQRIPDVCIA